MKLQDIKLEYYQQELNKTDLSECPYLQLKSWMQDAIDKKIDYANACQLTTIDSKNFPRCRTVLIKDISLAGIQFFTDYRSQKARDIEFNSNVSIHIFWKESDRQIRLLGKTSKLSPELSKAYFDSRPKESKISCLASFQSSVVTKNDLGDRVELLSKQFEDQEVPYPEFWGGYNITITEAEFWQGRPNRLHDRFQYIQDHSQKWNIQRLSP